MIRPLMRDPVRPHSRPLQIGFVGCGFVTRHRHLPTLQHVREVKVVALADLDPAALNSLADRYQLERRYPTVERLIEDPEVEAVAVCLPVAGHAAVAMAVLEAGKHLFVEKPLTLQLEEADSLIARAARTSAKVMVGFNLRWHRHVQAAQGLVASGGLGRVHGLRTVFSDTVLSRKGLPVWRSRRKEGGGVLLDKLAHHFDLWRFLLGDEVDEVFALTRSGESDDHTVSVTASMRGGALVTTLGFDDAFTSHELTLYAQRGGVHVDCYRFDGLVRSTLGDLPGAPRTRLRHLAQLIREPRATITAIRQGGDFNASYQREWRHFAESIRTNRPPACGLTDGRASLEIALAAARSATLGAPVKIAAGAAGRGSAA